MYRPQTQWIQQIGVFLRKNLKELKSFHVHFFRNFIFNFLLSRKKAKFEAKIQKKAKKWSKWPQIKKVRPLSFLQLLKLKKVKCAYFFNLRPSWPFFGHFLIFLARVRLAKMSKNGHNMVKMASNLKSGHTFTFSTLKVE